MRIAVLKKLVGSFTFLLLLLMLASTHAVAASPTLLQTKQEAEVKGYLFITTHDEIVAMAKKEGKLVVMTGLESANFKALINGFKQKYPFFTDIQIREVSGTEALWTAPLQLERFHRDLRGARSAILGC